MNPALILMVGSLMQGAGSAYGGLMSVKMGRYAQEVSEWQQRYSQTVANLEIKRVDRMRDQIISSQRAQTAASGISPLEGAPMELEAETRIMADIDKKILRISGSIEGLRFYQQGQMDLARGYSTAAAFGAQGFGSLMSAGMNYGQMKGWFTPESSSGSLLSSNNNRIPYMPGA